MFAFVVLDFVFQY